MAILLGKAQITTINDAGTASMYLIAATQTAVTSAPNIQSGSMAHDGDVKETKNQSGQVSSLFNSEETITQNFEFIPEAGSTNTKANSRVAAGLPAVLTPVALSGFPVISIGSFADVFNATSVASNPWIYEGGGKINLVSDGPWTMSLELKRRIGITSGTAVT